MVVYLSPRRIFTIIPWLQHLFCLNISHFSMHLFWHWTWLYQGQDVKLVAQPRGSIRDPHSTPSPGSCPAGSWGDFQGCVSPSPWMSMTCSEGPTFAGLLLWQWRMKLGLSSGPGSGTYQLCVRLIMCTSRCFVRMKWMMHGKYFVVLCVLNSILEQIDGTHGSMAPLPLPLMRQQRVYETEVFRHNLLCWVDLGGCFFVVL